MSLAPVVVIHLTAALAAVLVGPLALWTRLAAPVRPRWHRALGYGWFTCMVAVVLSALFIRSRDLPNIAGYTPLHLLVPVTSFLLYRGLAAVMRGDIAAHRRTMQRVYIGACLVAGSFTLLPQRYLGQLLWGQWLGWL